MGRIFSAPCTVKEVHMQKYIHPSLQLREVLLRMLAHVESAHGASEVGGCNLSAKRFQVCDRCGIHQLRQGITRKEQK
jgi:hypothetical protein